jgi:hypothetical protein
MTRATRTSFNKQGRAISESMRLRDFKRFLATLPAEREAREETHRGHTIRQGYKGSWSVTEIGSKVWPVSFSSLAKARAAVDRCHEIRAEVTA